MEIYNKLTFAATRSHHTKLCTHKKNSEIGRFYIADHGLYIYMLHKKASYNIPQAWAQPPPAYVARSMSVAIALAKVTLALPHISPLGPP